MSGTEAAGRPWSRPAMLVGVPLALAIAVRLYIGGEPSFPNDDAYISQHSAHFLTQPTDPSYQGATPLTGATSLVHVLLLWLGMRFLPAAWAVELVSWMGGLVYLVGVASLVRHLVERTWLRWALVLISLTVGSAAFHLAGGQETGWAMAAVIWTLHWINTDSSQRRRLALMAGVLPWIRPDLALLSVATGAHRLTSVPRRWLHDLIVAAVIGFAGMALYFGLSGSLWPGTMQAKVSFFAESGQPLWQNAQIAWVSLRGWIVVLGPAAIALVLGAWWSRTSRFGTAALAGLVCAGTVVAPSLIGHNAFRYLQPLSVPLIVLALARADRMWRDLLIASTLVWIGVSIPHQVRGWVDAHERFASAQAEVADWADRNLPPQSSVLVHDAGFLSEHTDMRLTDLVGLKSPRALELHVALTGPSTGARRAEVVHRLACESNAGYFVTSLAWDESFGLTSGLSSHGWTADEVFFAPVGDGTSKYYSVKRLGRSPQC